MESIKEKLVNKMAEIRMYKNYANKLDVYIKESKNFIEIKKWKYYTIHHIKGFVEFNRVTDEQKAYTRALWLFKNGFDKFSTQDLKVLVKKHPIKYKLYKQLIAQIPDLVEELEEHGMVNVFITITENIKEKETEQLRRRKLP